MRTTCFWIITRIFSENIDEKICKVSWLLEHNSWENLEGLVSPKLLQWRGKRSQVENNILCEIVFEVPYRQRPSLPKNCASENFINREKSNDKCLGQLRHLSWRKKCKKLTKILCFFTKNLQTERSESIFVDTSKVKQTNCSSFPDESIPFF